MWDEDEFGESPGQNGPKALGIGELLRSRFQLAQKGGQIRQGCLYGGTFAMRARDGQFCLATMAGLCRHTVQQEGSTGNGFEMFVRLC